MKKTILALLPLLFFGCQPAPKEEGTETQMVEVAPTNHHSDAIAKIFEAHGGFEKWYTMRQLSYTRGEERMVTNLRSRKIRLDDEKKTIGFDGDNVWVTPDSVDASNARFMHNLYFYFFAMPFIVGDPGVFYEDVDARQIKGKTLNGVKVSYDAGVGDSPKDNYIIWYDPETYQMEWLMYTVTYRSDEVSDNYRLIKYTNWESFEGVQLPTTIQWHHYTDGVAGELRNEVVFEEVTLSEEAPSESLFAMPENAQIAPLPERE